MGEVRRPLSFHLFNTYESRREKTIISRMVKRNVLAVITSNLGICCGCIEVANSKKFFISTPTKPRFQHGGFEETYQQVVLL